jgi:hypothetical protein
MSQEPQIVNNSQTPHTANANAAHANRVTTNTANYLTCIICNCEIPLNEINHICSFKTRSKDIVIS